jgi:hypothetical protein
LWVAPGGKISVTQRHHCLWGDALFAYVFAVWRVPTRNRDFEAATIAKLFDILDDPFAKCLFANEFRGVVVTECTSCRR